MENKAVMISVKPKWCNFIANEEKKIEMRKTKPNLKVPFKCLIYCTKPSKKHQTICGCHVLNDDELYRLPDGKIKYGDSIEMMVYDDCYIADNFLNGKVIGEFTCDRISEYSYISDSINEFTYNKNSESFYSISPDDCKSACLTQKDLLDYGKGKTLYGWHISDLVLYDKPKRITEFRKYNRECEYSDLGFAKPKNIKIKGGIFMTITIEKLQKQKQKLENDGKSPEMILNYFRREMFKNRRKGKKMESFLYLCFINSIK